MTDRFRVDVRLDEDTRFRELAEDVRRGLTSCPKFLLPKYFYDLAGSTLFDRITDLPEYYLTRAEECLLDELAEDLMRLVVPTDIVELGSGSSAKTRRLLEAGDGIGPAVRYVPIDVDLETVAGASARLLKDYPALRVHAVIGDFERHLDSVPPPEGRRLVLFLGSTIGNLDPPARRTLLKDVRQLLGREDRFLLGVDLVKDVRVLEAAYNDGAGVTAAFNRNILRVVNRAVGGDFQPEAFRHLAFYNDSASRIEMHLVAGAPQVVRLRRLGFSVDIASEERIFTESSYKFTRQSIEADLREARLRMERWYTDAEQRFALVLAALA